MKAPGWPDRADLSSIAPSAFAKPATAGVGRSATEEAAPAGGGLNIGVSKFSPTVLALHYVPNPIGGREAAWISCLPATVKITRIFG